MLSLLLDPEETLDVPVETRQSRRQDRRDKAIESEKRKTGKYSGKPKSTSKKSREKAAQREVKLGKIKPEDHCEIVANAIVVAAGEIDRLADEKHKWFQSRDQLINALAVGHNIVKKYRPALSVTTKYERDVISAALTLCELDNLLRFEKWNGWVRLHVQDTPLYMNARGHKLRAA